jgi:hypothetical protein
VAAPAQAPPGTPVYTVVGGLQCGVRLNNGVQGQAWCFDLAGQTLLYNAVGSVNSASGTSGAATFGFTYAEPTVQRSTGILWTVWEPQTGAPIQYRIWSGSCTVTPPQTGTGTCTPNITGPSQQGTLQ